MTNFRPVVALTALSLLGAAVPAADAATRLVIRGGGFGHGVGMSQYGALGFAQNGRTYDQILGHYYTGTKLGRLDADPTVRVLLQSGRRAVTFTAAGQAGDRTLQPGRTYSAATGAGGRVVLRSSSGRTLRTFDAPLRVIGSGGAPVRLVGGASSGTYRGALELRPSTFGGLNAINAVSLEDYVRGVVSKESPSSWPAEALKAQAVAARTYAITTNKPGAGFDHYPDTRSQVYAGVAAETPTTDAAVRDTAREVVTYDGKPVVTYFFSTSGGRTENAEFGFPGGAPSPHLKSVEDPFDDVSPRHTWGPYRYTMAQAQAKLGGLVRGRLTGIEVVQRGRSPRIVRAEIVGTGGRTPVDGPTLRRRFGLFDSWAYFTVVGTKVKPKDPAPGDGTGKGAPAPGSGGTGAMPARAAATVRAATVSGRVIGVARGTKVVVQRRTRAATWTTEVRTKIGPRGRYAASVSRAGVYRVRVAGVTGPSVRLR